MQTVKQSTFRIFTSFDLGKMDYEKTWDLQKELHQRRKENSISDILLFVEHPHTYTLGKTAKKGNLISSEKYLNEKGIAVFEIDRGGDITYHGPGQLVGYPIISLTEWKQDTHKYLRAIEEVIIRVCREYGLTTGRNENYTGVWIEDRKIAAIGIKVSNWITMHGFAFNVNPDLSLFKGIIPCGIQDKDVTSLEKELNKKIDMNEVKELILKHFAEVFSYSHYYQPPEELYETLEN